MQPEIQDVLAGKTDGCIVCGDALDVLRTMPDECVDCCVCSPPYWGLRDYGVEGQVGLEATPDEYVTKIVEVFREVRRVLAGHGTCWVNLGSSYCSGTDANRKPGNGDCASWTTRNQPQRTASVGGFKPKDMVPIPWMVAMALQADGWWLRQDIILSKRNPMPESCTDRCTKSHEYFFLLTKKARYYFDNEAIKEPNSEAGAKRLAGKPVKLGGSKNSERADMPFSGAEMNQAVGRNKRSVWEVVTEPTKEAHFATFGQKWIEPCILAGCPREVCRVCGKPRERIVEKPSDLRYEATGKTIHADGNIVAAKRIWERTRAWSDCGCGAGFRPGIVLDPFGGSGTVGVVAARLKRDYVLIELNEKYVEEIAKPRLAHVEVGVPVKEQRAGQMGLFE